ncbi:FKBP-type peptidyl-prolyl cis-trans isomerase [bacterium]|nr:FKBP-type peptidyl-prolyl cis-trans isomerase [bacterium]
MTRYWICLISTAVLVSGCQQEPAANVAPAGKKSAGTWENVPGYESAAPVLQFEDLVAGSGAEAKSGMTLTVHYTGWLKDSGKVFDSSKTRNTPFTFPLGAGRVIRGWDEGMVGMKVGGKRKLTIPPDYGYGSDGAGGVIPPNATLIFEVELLDVK